jgi:hypothetical protein
VQEPQQLGTHVGIVRSECRDGRLPLVWRPIENFIKQLLEALPLIG